MSVKMIDRTGEPRSDEEILNAHKVVTKHITTGISTVPPDLYVELLCIRDALTELLQQRKAVAVMKNIGYNLRLSDKFTPEQAHFAIRVSKELIQRVLGELA